MKWLRNYGLSLTLGVLFLLSWVFQYVTQVVWEGETLRQFWISTLENWQSEFLQLLTFVVLTSFLIHKGSHESKDSQDRQERKIDVLLLRRGIDPSDMDEGIADDLAEQIHEALLRKKRRQGGTSLGL